MNAIHELSALSEELDEYAKRLKARAAQIRALSPDALTPAVLADMIAESMQEQVDTGLDFVRELIVRTATAISELPAGGDDDGEAEVGIEPEDAAQIQAVIGEHIDMLEQYMASVPDQKLAGEVQQRIDRAKGVRKLVTDLTFDDEEEDEEGGDDEDDDADDEAT